MMHITFVDNGNSTLVVFVEGKELRTINKIKIQITAECSADTQLAACPIELSHIVHADL